MTELDRNRQTAKGEAFRALHQRAGAFVIPNPWDAGSGRLLASLGFEALATTSAGFAFSLGKRDGKVGRPAMMAHIASIASASELPVSADLENGFADDPDEVAETILLAAQAGASGGSIEDATGRPGESIYDEDLACRRIQAAAQAVKTLPFPFLLTARCENYLNGKPGLADTIRRLQAYRSAGADVVYAPGITSHQDIAALVQSVDCPVNVLVGVKGLSLSVAEASALGVKRVSVGSALARAAYGSLLRASSEIQDHREVSSVISNRHKSAQVGTSRHKSAQAVDCLIGSFLDKNPSSAASGRVLVLWSRRGCAGSPPAIKNKFCSLELNGVHNRIQCSSWLRHPSCAAPSIETNFAPSSSSRPANSSSRRALRPSRCASWRTPWATPRPASTSTSTAKRPFSRS